MANFEPAFSLLMQKEGVVLTNDPHDRGKQTFAGISRKFHPGWLGWRYVDHGETPTMDLVRGFYRENYWEPIHADQITSQNIANALFGQFVNMGTNGVKLLQTALGVIADGKVGAKTLAAINKATETHIVTPEEALLLAYSVVNTKRYHAIGMKDKTQRRFWPGWIKRSLELVK
jgi:lysozyme family protein